MYIIRHIETTMQEAMRQTKVVLLTGARQVGKTTAVRAVFPDYEYVTLDDENDLSLALEDRTLFFKDRSFPVIIDEVQYAKDLMREIKRVVDRSEKKGRIFLTGSQTYDLMSMASESLAGRVTILEMCGLSMREIHGVSFNQAFLPTEGYIAARKKEIVPYAALWEKIHRGSMPELLDDKRNQEWFYRDYVRTYIERDVRQLLNVRDGLRFRSFLVSLAARSAQLLVYEDVARDVGIDIKTAQHWLSVVAASGLVQLIRPYHNNAIKRTIKTPKLYFLDTGLLCFLVGWKTPESAKNGAMSGSIYETFVVSEVLKSYRNMGAGTEHIYYYRDKDKKEIDLLIEEGSMLYPVEIKKGATISRDWIKHFAVLDRIADREIGPGAVICQAEKALPITESVMALPVEYI